jgi:uncharacterized membrane protein
MLRNIDEENRETVSKGLALSYKVFLLLFLGFILIVVGMAVILVASVFYWGGSVSGGAVIFIGPFPIVIGAGPDVTWIVFFSIILAVLSIVVLLVINRKMRWFGE